MASEANALRAAEAAKVVPFVSKGMEEVVGLSLTPGCQIAYTWTGCHQWCFDCKMTWVKSANPTRWWCIP
jgi:hypothetical protein